MRKLLAAAFLMFVAAAPAAAQVEKPVDVNLGFGWALPEGGLKDSFDAGWNGQIAATFNLSPKLGVQGEYMYMRMGGPDKTINVSVTPGGPGSNQLLESNHQVHALTGNLVYKSHSADSAFGTYALGGLGYYHRKIQITSPAVGYATYCDPYWYVCYPTAVSVDNILGDRSSNDFGINFGGGVTFGHEVKFYFEARYHYVWGPEVQAQGPVISGGPCQTEKCSTNAQYFPLTFGVRW
jgi:opacity protein-like surface antigen